MNSRVFLVAILALCAASCGGKEPLSREDQQAAAFADLRAAIVETVADEARRATVLGLAAEFETDVDALREVLVQRRTENRRLNADYDTDREEFLRFANEMEAKIQENRRRIFQDRARLIEATTAEEWKILTKTDTKAMRSIALSVYGI
jgi:hypothetical protein